MVDREGKILFWNAGVQRITGYLRQDVLGHRCQDRFLEHTDAGNIPLEGSSIPLLETMREGRPVLIRTSLRNKGGHFLAVRLRTVPLWDERGSIQGAVEILEELASSSRMDRRQNKLAAYGCIDGLTGLLNHSRIQAHLREQLALYAEHPVPFCLLCFAIDDLAKLRERYGQAAVDAALRVVGQTLANGLRPTDFIGHWQENEFIAILLECVESDVRTVGHRLQKMVQHAEISWWGDMLRVTVSAGATPAHDHDSVESIIRRAEEALKQSSDSGKGQIALLNN